MQQVISVSQASVRQYCKDADGGKKWERGIGQVKTKSSVRVLYFGETLKQQLLAYNLCISANSAGATLAAIISMPLYQTCARGHFAVPWRLLH